MKGVKRFQTRGKLAPRFIGPFPIMSRVGTVAYQLELPPELSDVHNVFHVSQLRQCILPPEKKTDMIEIELAKDLTYEERTDRILDQMERVALSKARKFYKVQWEHHTESESTWEQEQFLRAHYQDGFPKQPNLEDEIHSKWGRFVTAWFLPSLLCLIFSWF